MTIRIIDHQPLRNLNVHFKYYRKFHENRIVVLFVELYFARWAQVIQSMSNILVNCTCMST